MKQKLCSRGFNSDCPAILALLFACLWSDVVSSMAVFKSGSLLLELAILGEKRDVQVDLYSFWPQGLCVSVPQGIAKNSVLLLNLQTKYFIIMMLSMSELFTPNNIIAVYLLFIYLTEDISVGGFEGCFLSWWEYVQKMFYSSLEGIFIAQWGFECEWSFLFSEVLNRHVQRTLLYVDPWFYCPLPSPLPAEETLPFSVRYRKFNSCNIILL